MSSNETIASLGENESLRRTIAMLNLATSALVGPGDDAAVVAAPDGRFCVTTDTMVEGHDFRLDWSSGFDLGWKAVATNVSDIAAMGGKPTALVVALAAPASTTIDWLEAFADGLREACIALAPEAAVVGGDLTTSAQVFIAVTAHGSLEGHEPVLRSGAKLGDVIAVGGTLGKAAAGLALLQSGNSDAIAAYDELVSIQRRPQPPIALGPLAAEAGASSMLDVSDGLSRDLARIAAASKVLARVDSRALQGYQAIIEQAAQAIGASERNWVLHGGEDHSLLATFPADATIPRGFKPIGVIEAGEGVFLDAQPLEIKGWDSTV